MTATEPLSGQPLRDRRFAGYEQPRADVQALVPRDARRVLDIGCASGALGEALKRRPGVEVVGVELGSDYAAHARARLDDVVEGDATDVLCAPDARERLGTFDCIIAADLLEHLADPFATVRGAAMLLDDGGTFIASLPNVRFWQTFWHVGVRGRWPRRDTGLFDRTHLQWFTRTDAVALLEQAGLRVVLVKGRYKLNYMANKVDRLLGPLLRLSPLRAFFAYQYLLVAIPVADRRPT
ncbi:MAG TPA: class I SAM-dependent methyltransferase [Solirubrobacteraceae bacterium]|nr:class I SAM-dependent methyltransferase [Solirubrobacteraceae bacterium]